MPAILGYYRPLLTKTPFVHFSSTCIPGFKIHVDTKGLLHPCERSPTEIIVGDVDNGLDWSKIRNVLIKYRDQALKVCNECSISYACPNCIAFLGLKGDLETCRIAKEGHFHNMGLAMQIYSVNPEFFKQRFGKYLEIMRFLVNGSP